MLLTAHIPLRREMLPRDIASLTERLLRQPHVQRVELDSDSRSLAVQLDADYPTFVDVQRLVSQTEHGQSTKLKTMASFAHSEVHIG